MAGRYENEFSVFKDIADDIGKELRETCLDIDRMVVNETPIDTGAAKGNWLASVNVPETTRLTGVNASTALAQARTTIATAPSFATVYIQNNLPYIVRLNEGWSLQAPTKYIDRIVERVADARK